MPGMTMLDEETQTEGAWEPITPPAGYTPEAPGASQGFDGALIADILPPALSEDGLALEFSRQYAEDWRYVHAWGRWLSWDGTVWRREKTRRIINLIKGTCRDVDARHPKADGKTRGVKWKTICAVEKMAQADPRHDCSDDIWDRDPWALNTPKGIIDLKTGEVRPNDPTELMTQTASASMGDDCPRWVQFLQEITDGDDDLAQYLARVAGYILTGVTTEHALFFIYGTGRNGKGKFIATLAAIMGDYFTGLPLDALMETKTQQHTTDLAGLRNARMVSSDEIDKGRRWAKAKVSAMTGGGNITARLMRQDNTTFRGKFKLIISGNNKPAINDVDEAIRSRMHLIPFTVKFLGNAQDKELESKLLAERDGILAWAVQGCLDWQQAGLRPPESVVAATKDYLESEDSIGRWILECCQVEKSARETGKKLFDSWRGWAELSGENFGNIKRFTADLEKREFRKFQERAGNVFFGLCVRGSVVQEHFALNDENA